MQFGNVTIEQILFTMLLPLQGTASSIYISFFKHFLIPTFISSVFLMIIIILIEDIKYFNKVLIRNFKNFLLVFFIIVFAILVAIAILPNRTNKFYNSKQDNNFVAYNFNAQNNNVNITDSLASVKTIQNNNVINDLLKHNKQLSIIVENNKNIQNILKDFNERIILENFSIYEYNESIEKDVKYPSMFVYEYENFKDVLRYNVKIISVHENFFKEYINMFEYFHKKDIVVVVHISFNEYTNKDFIENNLGNTCSIICIDDIGVREK